MESDPSVYPTNIDHVIPSSFPQRLLQVGETDCADEERGRRVFKIIEELFPIEAQIYGQAINELLSSLEHEGSSESEVASSGTEARLLLGITLVPFIQIFMREYLASGPQISNRDAVVKMQTLSRVWALTQLRRSVTYITALRIRHYQRSLRNGGFDQQDVERMAALREIIDEHGGRPEAAPLVDRARQEYSRLAKTLSQAPAVDSVRPRALSYLLECTSEGQLKDMALAALIMKGNSSPGAEAVANPLQLLEVADVADVLGVERSSITSNVSKIRGKAIKHERIANIRPELHPRHLWMHVPAETTTSPAER